MTEQVYFVYILSNQTRSVLYLGVTNDLMRRVFEHREGIIKGFTSRYNVFHLMYYETFGSIESAIIREKKLKGSSRSRKEKLIESQNPQWVDLYPLLDREEFTPPIHRNDNNKDKQ